MQSMQFQIKNKNGDVKICDVIATYHDEKGNKDFIVYTDRTLDHDDKLKVYYSLYEMIDNNIRLVNIEDNNDKVIGLELVKEILSDVNKEL